MGIVGICLIFGVPVAVTVFSLTRAKRKEIRYDGDDDFASNDLKQRRDDVV